MRRLATAIAAGLLPLAALGVESDLGASLATRLRTPALLLEGQGGLSQVVWGNPADGAAFGYVRASGALRTSGLTNGYRAQLEFYPVSILGVTLGSQSLHRLADNPGADCDRLDCEATLTSRFVQGRAVLGAGGFFGQFVYQRDFFADRASPRALLFEPVTILQIDPREDVVSSGTILIGYRVDDAWSAGAVVLRASARKSDDEMKSEMLFARWKPADLTYSLAAGRAGSRAVGVGPQVAATVTWWPKARVGF